MKKKLAHEIIIEEIERHCKTLSEVDKTLSKTDLSLPKRQMISQGRMLECMAVAVLSELLGLIIIPESELAGIIARLRPLRCWHAVISNTIEKLSAPSC